MGKETNSSLDTFTEQTIFDFLSTIFSPHSNTKFVVLWNIYYFPKILSYQFLAFKGLYIQTNLDNKFFKKFTKPNDPLLNFDPHT